MLVLWIFEFGYLLQHLATYFQIDRINKVKNTDMVSLDTNIYFFVGTICRLVWMWDSALKSFYLAYLEITISVISLAYVLWLFKKYKVNSYVESELKQPFYLKPYVLIPIIVVLSFLFHPGSKGKYYYTSQMFVSGNIFSEAIGLLPQLYIFFNFKETGDVSSQYVIFQTLSRFSRIIFWIKMYIDGNNFISLIIADVVHSILLVGFIFLFYKNKDRGSLPTSNTGQKKLF
jgi:ER lumen protein retaining receptor